MAVRLRLRLEEAVAAGADGIEHAFQPQDPGSTAEARDVAAHNGDAGYLR